MLGELVQTAWWGAGLTEELPRTQPMLRQGLELGL